MQSASTFPLSGSIVAKSGVSIDRLCEQAGVAVSSRYSTEDFFRLWYAADEVFGDRSAGLKFGANAIDGGYGVAALVALHAPDMRKSLAALSRYKRLTCPELVEIEERGEELFVRYRWLEATTLVPRLLVDTTMSSLRELVGRGTGRKVSPVRLELARRPSDRVLLTQHFSCPIHFGAQSDAMVFHRTALGAPYVTANGGAFARLLRELEPKLANGEGFPALVGELRVAIACQLNEGRAPGMADVARRLGLSGRTLQRRLDACGTTFQHQLAGVRRTAASRLLAETDLDPVAISMLLGFAEPNSFTRAFRSWQRISPLRWRALHASPQSAINRTQP